ncbi:MAG: histidine--tRNA ligase [Clostridia bacterium]|nr:histidine--tRNA ligase [Clostridia bacterium]
MAINRPRGTSDILPEDMGKWLYLEEKAREVCLQYGYQEIRTPVFEHTELFDRGIGETTDIVEKEMYEFRDKGNRSITLVPEGTAPVVRAYIENKIYAEAQPTKLFYIAPMFRYGRPQAGRLRQFHQFGIEAFGSNDPAIDAEVIALSMDYYKRVGLVDLELHINSVGCPRCRAANKEKLLNYLRPYTDSLCDTCESRLERNPLRIFDCKSETCNEIMIAAPKPFDSLCEECLAHYELVREYLGILNVPYIENRELVRGLDYYTKTAFEIMVQGIGAQSSIGGGGRYDLLVEECGGPDTPGIGFGLGMERILLALDEQGQNIEQVVKPKIFIATANTAADSKETKEAVRILAMLRQEGFLADKDYLGRSLRAQMRFAHRQGFKILVIVAEEELGRGNIVVRDMGSGEQREIGLDAVLSELKAVIGGINNG